jgi:hypothetical protein
MRRFEARVIGAILLIVAGVLFLLQNLGVSLGSLTLLWALLFGAGGVVFLYVFLTDRANWWALIPGFALLGLASVMVLNQLAPRLGEVLGGALFLGGIGLAFWMIYFTNRENWWALIPGGVMATLALVTVLSSFLAGAETGGVFMLGLGLTFGLLSLVRTPEGRMSWALIPAAVFVVIGLAITAATASLLQYLWPAALIALGLYMIFRVVGSRRVP